MNFKKIISMILGPAPSALYISKSEAVASIKNIDMHDRNSSLNLFNRI